MGNIRLLDLGYVPSLRSQTLYHALAHGMASCDPDTVVLVSPLDPYVCVGFHQDIEREVDLARCQEERLPVYRREVGGGAVYLDRNQLFTQWIFHPDHLPSSIGSRFELHSRPLVETYRAFGIQAHYRPLNDIHVHGRKIGGMGAAGMGDAEVVVASLMFDFDSSRMSRVLKVSSEKMRDKVYQGLREYMTTMAKELGQAPDRDEVKAIYLDRFREVLGPEIVPGVLTEKEEALVREWDNRFLSSDWLYQRDGRHATGVKIHEDVRLGEASRKAPGGLIRATVCLRNGRIDELTLSGDFTMLPLSGITHLEAALQGTDAQPEAVAYRIRHVYQSMRLQSPGVTPEDFAIACTEAMANGAAG